MTINFFHSSSTSATQIHSLPLHDALPISQARQMASERRNARYLPHAAWPEELGVTADRAAARSAVTPSRSEEHTSELQSRPHLVCRLLPEKKKKTKQSNTDEEYRPDYEYP